MAIGWRYFVFKIWNCQLFLIYLHYPSIPLKHNSEDGHKAVDIHPLSFSTNGKDNKQNLKFMRETENNTVGYQFTPTPKQLMHLLDVNCRTMLFALVDNSNYFANADGWFYRTNSDLQNDSKLSKNLVMVTVDTLFRYGIVDVSCIGKGKGKKPNGYRVNTDRFTFFEQLNMNTDIGRPENQIETIRYKGSGYSPSYLQDKPTRLKPMLKNGVITWIPINAPNALTPSPTKDDTSNITNDVTKSDNNIDSIDNIDIKDNIKSKDNLLNNNILNKEIRGKRVIEEETLVKLFEEANSIESQPKGGMSENLNNHQQIENKNISPSENKKINRILEDVVFYKTYPRLANVEPIDDDTYSVLLASLKDMALSTKEDYKTKFVNTYRQFQRLREQNTKEKMKYYTKALQDIQSVLSGAYTKV